MIHCAQSYNLKYFQILIVFFSLISNLAFASSPNADSCSYYSEIESQHQCGERGYIQKFAKPYCQSYLNKNNRFTAHGQKVLRNIRFCLQDALNKNLTQHKDLNCNQLEQYGIQSHEQCYIDSGFCNLNPIDAFNVYWIARNEISNPDVWDTFLNIQVKCGVNNAPLFVFPEVRSELNLGF